MYTICYCNNLIRKSNTSNLKDFGRKKANNVISYTAVYILYIFHHQSAVLIFTRHNENPMVVHFLQVPSVISGITYMYDCIFEHPLHFIKKNRPERHFKCPSSYRQFSHTRRQENSILSVFKQPNTNPVLYLEEEEILD